MKEKIAIIGNGNMGQAIIKGLLDKKIVTKDRLFVSDSETNNKEVVQKADIILLAVKPHVIEKVVGQIRDVVKNQLIISIAAGIRIQTIQIALGKDNGIVRVMPNLSAKVGCSMSVWVCSKEVTDSQKQTTKTILEAIGVQLELRGEEQLDAATAISGSGPAYFFYLTEILEKTAVELGFSQTEARVLSKQTLVGSAELLKSSTQSAEDLKISVTSKGGTTEAAFSEFKKGNMEEIVKNGIMAAYKKAKGLGMK